MNKFLGLFPWLNLKRTPLVGLDISTSAVKVLGLSKEGEQGKQGKEGSQGKPGEPKQGVPIDQYRVSNFCIEPLPPNSTAEGRIQDPEAVANTVREAMRKSGATTKNVAISVSGSTVLSKIVQMGGDFTDQEISDQIELESERYFPFPLEEVYYDFEVLGPSTKNAELIDVLIGVARIETVDEKVNIAKLAGLRPTMVDIDAIAMERAYALVSKHLSEEDKAGKIGLVDIGANVTTFYVFQGHLVLYNREQVFGGKQLVDEIQRRYGLSLEEALAQMKFGQLPEDYNQEVLVPFRDNVVQHISRAIQTFAASYEDPQLKYLLLAGGVAELPGLDNLIQTTLNLRTMIANPFLEMQIAPKVNKKDLMDEGPSLMVCSGLALRTFEE